MQGGKVVNLLDIDKVALRISDRVKIFFNDLLEL